VSISSTNKGLKTISKHGTTTKIPCKCSLLGPALPYARPIQNIRSCDLPDVRYTNQRTLSNLQACSYILVDKKVSHLFVSKQEICRDGRARERYGVLLGNVQVLLCSFILTDTKDGWSRQVS